MYDCLYMYDDCVCMYILTIYVNTTITPPLCIYIYIYDRWRSSVRRAAVWWATTTPSKAGTSARCSTSNAPSSLMPGMCAYGRDA